MATIIKFPLIHSSSNLITVEQRIVKLCSENSMQVLRKEELTEMKFIIVDFLYKLKDRHPSSNPKEMLFDVAHRVLNFMRDNNLNPSKALIEEYRQSKTTKTLNRFPSLEE